MAKFNFSRRSLNSSKAASISSLVFSASAVISSDDPVIPIVGMGSSTISINQLERMSTIVNRVNAKLDLTSNHKITSIESLALGIVRARIVLADNGDDR